MQPVKTQLLLSLQSHLLLVLVRKTIEKVLALKSSG
jgi:hypothetical protein